MNPDLLRQRRNLILISGALFLSQLAEVSVKKISILGTELIIQNMEVFGLTVWIVWGYFLLRYCQHLQSEEDLKIRSSHRDYFQSTIREYAKPKFKSFNSWNGIHIKRNSWYEYICETESSPDVAGDAILTVEIPFLFIFITKIKSWWYVTINTPAITNYVLPIVVALSPLILVIYKNA